MIELNGDIRDRLARATNDQRRVSATSCKCVMRKGG